jgi:hypothetical protein
MVHATRAYEHDDFICGVLRKLVMHDKVDCFAGAPATFLATTHINFFIDTANACFDVPHLFP